jgi:hypothetical protein
VGVNIKYTIRGLTAGELASITIIGYDIINPDGVLHRTTPTKSAAILSYLTLAADLTGEGYVTVIPYIETSTGLKKHLDAATFFVKDPTKA